MKAYKDDYQNTARNNIEHFYLIKLSIHSAKNANYILQRNRPHPEEDRLRKEKPPTLARREGFHPLLIIRWGSQKGIRPRGRSLTHQSLEYIERTGNLIRKPRSLDPFLSKNTQR